MSGADEIAEGRSSVADAADSGAHAKSAAKVVPHFTRVERAARGKAARTEVPRATHAQIEFPAGRDPVALLEEQAASRVPELVPIRYGRMLASPFAFYRGGALIMASDLARTPTSGLRAQLCGDAHLLELWRLRLARADVGVRHERLRRDVAGAMGVGREAAGGELRDRRTRVWLLRQGAAGGRARHRARPIGRRCATFAAMRNLELWYSHLSVEQAFAEFARGVDPKRLKKAEANVAKARTKDSMHAFEKLTTEVDGERRIVSDPPLIVPIDELIPAEREREAFQGEIHELIRSYRRTIETDRRHLLEQFRFVDLARKVVGVGQRRHPRLDRALPRHRRGRPALPAGQGGPTVGAGAVRRQERVRQLRSARRRRPAADAGDAATSSSAGSTSAQVSTAKYRDFYVRQLQGLEGLASRSRPPSPQEQRRTGRRAAGPSPAAMPAPATGSRSPPTSATPTPSTRQSRTSPRPTPTRTNVTTKRCRKLSPRAKSRHRPGSDTPRLALESANAADLRRQATTPQPLLMTRRSQVQILPPL